MTQRKILPLPRGLDIRKYLVSKVRCGFFVLELIIAYKNNLRLSGKKQEASHHIIGQGMLPWHMIQSLKTKGLNPKYLDLENSNIKKIIETLDQNIPVVAFIGTAVGHWVAIWGYDDNNLYLFDNRYKLERDENNLFIISHEEFCEIWNKIPPLLKPFLWLGKCFTELKIKPRTMIIPW